jgi:hypothetical protein
MLVRHSISEESPKDLATTCQFHQKVANVNEEMDAIWCCRL